MLTEAQKALRRTGVGASECAAALGLRPAFTGRAGGNEQGDRNETTEMHWHGVRRITCRCRRSRLQRQV